MFPRVIDMKILIFYIFPSLHLASFENVPLLNLFGEKKKKTKRRMREKEKEAGVGVV